METNIKTVEQAFAYTGREYASIATIGNALPEKDRAHFLSDYQLKVAIEALNKESNNGNDWQAELNGNPEERELWVWIKGDPTGVGFVVTGSDTGWTTSIATVGSRHLLRNEVVYKNLREHFSGLFYGAYCK